MRSLRLSLNLCAGFLHPRSCPADLNRVQVRQVPSSLLNPDAIIEAAPELVHRFA